MGRYWQRFGVWVYLKGKTPEHRHVSMNRTSHVIMKLCPTYLRTVVRWRAPFTFSSITVETTQCIEEILQECGTYPFSLAKEIFGDVVKLGISAYCPISYRNDFFIEHMTTTLAPYQDRLKTFTDISPATGDRPYPQFVKGYRQKRDGDENGAGVQTISIFCMAAGLVLSIYMNRFWYVYFFIIILFSWIIFGFHCSVSGV